MRLEDGAIVTLHGMLGDQIHWALQHDNHGVWTPLDEFLRDHRQINLH